MTSTATTLEYTAGDTLCNGVYFVPEKANGPLPVVMVVHAWDGLNQEVRDKATKLADAGYIAFAVDVHGGGKTINDIAELLPTLTPYLEDRSGIQTRNECKERRLATAQLQSNRPCIYPA